MYWYIRILTKTSVEFVFLFMGCAYFGGDTTTSLNARFASINKVYCSLELGIRMQCYEEGTQLTHKHTISFNYTC